MAEDCQHLRSSRDRFGPNGIDTVSGERSESPNGFGPTGQTSTDRRRDHSGCQSLMCMLAELPVAVVLARLPVPVLVLGDDATIEFVNHAFADMLGHTRQSLSALSLPQIFPRIPITGSALHAFQDRAGCVVELAHADHSIVLARLSKSAMQRHDDPFALVVFEDLTEEIWTNPRILPRQG